MTQDEIEKAADKYAEAHDVEPYDEYGSGIRIGARFGFIAGAKWRINSVWHPCTERPEDGKMVLAISRNQHPFIGGPNNAKWDDTIREFNITKWAYVEDLVPEEDE